MLSRYFLLNQPLRVFDSFEDFVLICQLWNALNNLDVLWFITFLFVMFHLIIHKTSVIALR